MDEMADPVIKPMTCPRCGKKVIFGAGDEVRCEDCGELYYDQWLGIWRVYRHPEEG